jgi:hypothetical protein
MNPGQLAKLCVSSMNGYTEMGMPLIGAGLDLCLLCPVSDQIMRRSQMSRCARTGPFLCVDCDWESRGGLYSNA